MSFEKLGLCDAILDAAEDSGYTSPTPIQLEAIPSVIEGRDVLGCAQTGTGKTAAFAMPILHRLHTIPSLSKNVGKNRSNSQRPIRCLVLSPTRELAAQIGESFRLYGEQTKLRTTVIFGGVGQRKQTDDLERGVDIVVATPGRFLDLEDQGYVDLRSVETVVLDEADHMFDMGFLPDVRRILAKLPKKRQTLLFSATMPPEIRELALKNLEKPVRIRIVPDQETTDLIKQSIYFVEEADKATLLAQFLHVMPFGPALVFTRTKHRADAVVRKVAKLGIRAAAIHGNKSQTSRQTTLASFKSGKTTVLVATDIAARGIDVSGISYVFNYDLPDVPETYVHRIGRTGRAGDMGLAVTLCNSEQRKLLQQIQRHLRMRFPMGPQLAPMPRGIKPITKEDPPTQSRPKRKSRRKGSGKAVGKSGKSGTGDAGRAAKTRIERAKKKNSRRSESDSPTSKPSGSGAKKKRSPSRDESKRSEGNTKIAGEKRSDGKKKSTGRAASAKKSGAKTRLNPYGGKPLGKKKPAGAKQRKRRSD